MTWRAFFLSTMALIAGRCLLHWCRQQ
jgi:hypothetical protein